jgi:hypothetical protein
MGPVGLDARSSSNLAVSHSASRMSRIYVWLDKDSHHNNKCIYDFTVLLLDLGRFFQFLNRIHNR